MRLRDEWNSETMQTKKRNAASLLLKETPNEGTNVADVLDFFETVAVFMNRKLVDPYLAWHFFYWWMVHFYAAAATYIRARRELEGTKQWADLIEAVPKLLEIEGRPHNPPTAGDVLVFLRDESEPEPPTPAPYATAGGVPQ